MKGERVTVSYTLPKDLAISLKMYATEKGVPASRVAEEILAEGLKQKRREELRNKLIKGKDLKRIKGIVACGGNALADSEAVWDE